MSTMKDLQHKIILKYETSQDGILAWDEFKSDFAYDGSKELRLEQLENIPTMNLEEWQLILIDSKPTLLS